MFELRLLYFQIIHLFRSSCNLQQLPWRQTAIPAEELTSRGVRSLPWRNSEFRCSAQNSADREKLWSAVNPLKLWTELAAHAALSNLNLLHIADPVSEKLLSYNHKDADEA
jgi:hypothetical protein